MKKLLLSSILALTFNAAFATTPQELVQNETQSVLEIIKKAKNSEIIKTEVNKEIENNFDFPKITSMAVGKSWREATPEQKTQLSTEFRILLVNLYSNSMSLFKDATISIKNQSVTEDNAVVKTIVAYKDDGNKKSASVNYSLIKSKDSDNWKVYDINVEGLSLVLSYRTSFSDIVSKKGIDGLVSELHEKNNKKI